MTATNAANGRVRAYGHFIIAIFYYFLARIIARHGAIGLSSEQWSPVVEQTMLVFLLLLGYAGLGFTLNRQVHPLTAQGLPHRDGWSREVGNGVAFGWAMALACVIALAVGGGIAIRLSTQPSSWVWLAVDLLFFALAALAEEIAFRGYAFQRFAQALGSAGATIGFAAFYAFMQAMLPGTSRASIAVSIAFSLLLTTAYLRTRALWLSWGLNFGWKASRALIFGLAVSGINIHSPVIQGDPMGSFWLTGGGYGLDASWLAFFVILAGFPFLFRVTRDLNFRYNAPEFIPAGIPVDLDAAARRQHESAMGPTEPSAPTLVQIVPLPSGSPQNSAPQAPPTISGNDLP
jgi:membrane protease YdiL (CAAX protease family)